MMVGLRNFHERIVIFGAVTLITFRVFQKQQAALFAKTLV